MDPRHIPSPQVSLTSTCGVQEVPLCLVTVKRQPNFSSLEAGQAATPAIELGEDLGEAEENQAADSLPVDCSSRVGTAVLRSGDTGKQVCGGAARDRAFHVFRCGVCPETFRDPSALVQHLRSRHVSQEHSVQCRSCSKLFWFLSEVEEGNAWRRDREPFLCEACTAEYTSCLDLGSNRTEGAVERHVREQLSVSGASVLEARKRSTCSGSGSVVNSTSKSEPEKKKICAALLTGDLVKCSACSSVFSDPSQLDNHMCLLKDSHSPQTDQNSTGRERTSGSAEQQNSATNIPRILCKVCEMEFRSVAHLKRHMLTHSESRPHPCDECAACFKHASHLALHKKTHRRRGRESPHCEQCMKAFSSPQALKKHRQRDYCSSLYATPSAPFPVSL